MDGASARPRSYIRVLGGAVRTGRLGARCGDVSPPRRNPSGRAPSRLPLLPGEATTPLTVDRKSRSSSLIGADRKSAAGIVSKSDLGEAGPAAPVLLRGGGRPAA